MDEVIQLCRLKVNGQNLPQETEDHLLSFMLEPSNSEHILQTALNEFSILLCYRSLTSNARRKGEYFFRYENGSGEVRKLISLLEGVPFFKNKDENNLYLCLEGELLALSIYFQEPAESISTFLLDKVWGKDNSLEIKTHCMLKILTACLAEVVEIRSQRHIESSFKKIILGFSMTYGVMFASAITNISENILHNFNGFSLVFETLASLQLAQESFFAAIGQEEMIWNYREHGDGHEPYLMVWQSEFLINWVSAHCLMLQHLFGLLESSSIEGYKNHEKCCQVMTRSLSLLLHMLDLSFGNGEKGYKNLKGTILAEITSKLIDQVFLFFEIESIQEENAQLFLSGEFHANFLKLLLYKNKLLSIQLVQVSPQNIEDSKIIEKLLKYIDFVIKTQDFYYDDFQECPIGLVVKMRWKIKYILLENLRSEGLCSKNELKAIEKRLNNAYQKFFEEFLLLKLILNEDAGKENEDLFVKGKDWQEFVTITLNSYFNELAVMCPKYFAELSIIESDDSEDVMEEGKEEKGDIIHLDEVMIGNKFVEKGLKFSKNEGFTFFTKMIDEIKINRLLKIDFLLDENGEEKCLNTYNFVDIRDNGSLIDEDEDDSKNEEDEKAFAHLISILAAFRALIRISINSEIRALLYFYYYQIEHEINIHLLSDSQKQKAKICKIYILHTFLEELMPEEFIESGEESSLTAVYLLKEFGFDLEYFIDAIISSLYDCMNSCQKEEFFEEETDIIGYGIWLIEEMMKKVAGRLVDLEDSLGKRAAKDTIMYRTKMNEIFSTLQDLNIENPYLYQRVYALAGILIDINGYKTLYEIYTKISFSFHSNVDLYLHGLAGLLGGISRKEYFRAGIEISLGDLAEVVKEVGAGGGCEIVEVILGVVEVLVNGKVWDCIQDQIGIAVQDIFREVLPSYLERCTQTPFLLQKCLKIYLKWLNFDNLSTLIPLSRYVEWGKHTEILNEYFNSINRIGELNELEEYSMLKIDWFISFLECKVERNEDYSYNLGLIALNFRFEVQVKKDKMVNLLSIIGKVECEQISNELAMLYINNDACYEKFDE